MDDQLLQFTTQAIFVLLSLWTLVDLVRQPDRRRLEIAALFASLGVVVLVQGLLRIAGLDLSAVTTGLTLIILAQPYLLLRLVEHFDRLPRTQNTAGLVLTAASWTVVLIAGNPLPTWAIVGVVVPFAYIEVYATAAFVRAARRTRGVTQRRLVAVALGSGLLAAVILLAGVSAVVPDSAAIVPALSRLMGLASAIAYFVGFAPPRWLRRAWQMAELQRFLVGVGSHTAGERLMASLDRVGPAATRVLGAKTAIVALGPPGSERLDIHLDPENEGPLRASRVFTLTIGEDSPVLGGIWRGQVAAAALESAGWDHEIRRLAGAFGGAACALAAPLLVGGLPNGLIVVLIERGSLFMDDELALLSILAEQAALAVESSQLFLELRRQNAALEASTRLKSEFLANMSHELRTPLNAIIGFSELMIDAPADEDPATARVYLETIHSSGQHLLALINDVLDLSKVEAGKMELHLDEIRVADVVARALATVEPLAHRKAIALIGEVADAGTLVADEGRVKQVLLNLLSNAIKFTPDGGRITVEARRAADAVELTVSDTGIGIAPEDQERIFQEFQQIDGSASRRYEGTGLGLALTRRFVEMHGGRIWVESEAGRGSRFHVSFPLGARPSEPRHAEASVPHSSGPAQQSESAPGARPLVLVVEDDPRAANLLALYLGRGGYRVEVAPDGEAALGMARALSPLAITLDLDLPKIDGWDVLRELKLDERTRDVPVVIVSVVDNEELGYALGAVDYFVKPIDGQALLARLGKYRFTEQAERAETTILVVDDEPAAIELLAGMLAPTGFRVLRAGSGEEGIALALRERPDLVLLDLMMPGVNGFDVVVALKNEVATRDIPILVVTAKELDAEDKASLNGHVAKVMRKGAFGRVELLAWLGDLRRRLGAGEEVGRVAC